MINILKAAKHWETKSLEDLRIDATLEDSGIAFEALRAPNGRRIHIVLCVTGEEQIRAICSDYQFSLERPPKDWTNFSVYEALKENLSSNPSLTFEMCRGDSGELLAIAFIATDPYAVSFLDRNFGLPS